MSDLPLGRSWCQDDLKAINEAIAQGALRVQYGDKLIEYRRLDDMFAVRRAIMSDLGLLGKGSGRRYGDFNKGLK